MSPDIKIMKMTDTKIVPNTPNVFKSVLKQVSKWKKKKKKLALMANIKCKWHWKVFKNKSSTK